MRRVFCRCVGGDGDVLTPAAELSSSAVGGEDAAADGAAEAVAVAEHAVVLVV